MKKAALVMAVLGVLGLTAPALTEELPAMTVWKSPWCGCCGKWVEHVRAAGFDVQVNEVEDLSSVKQMAAVPNDLESCHTARVGGYTVEGHVPASDIIRLLDEGPNAHGLFVPDMPSGSPGMENGDRDPYDVLLLNRDGQTEVFSSQQVVDSSALIDSSQASQIGAGAENVELPRSRLVHELSRKLGCRYSRTSRAVSQSVRLTPVSQLAN